MSTEVYVLTIILILGTILIVFGMKYVSAAIQARSRTKDEQVNLRLAQRAVEAQTETAACLTAIEGRLTEVSSRLIVVEKILKDVG